MPKMLATLNKRTYANESGRSPLTLSSSGLSQGSMGSDCPCKPNKVYADESGRSMLEILAVLAIMILLSYFGIALYRRAVNHHKAEEIYSEIILEAMAYANRGTTRTTKGMVDTGYRPHDGEFAVEKDCPTNAFFIKVNNVEADVCALLMEKDWNKAGGAVAFYRMPVWGTMCQNSSVTATGYYMTGAGDCHLGRFDRGVFAVAFAPKGGAPTIQYCQANNACYPNCQVCDTAHQMCVDSGCPERKECTPSGECDWNFSYGDGYYISDEGEKTDCIENATCDGKHLTCDNGYYLDEGACTTCPENADCHNNAWTCLTGYQADTENKTCSCPETLPGAGEVCNLECGCDNGYCEEGACVSCGQQKACSNTSGGWCCDTDELCGDEVGECSDGKCSYILTQPSTTATCSYRLENASIGSNCSYELTITEDGVATMEPLTPCSDGQWCYLSHNNEGCTTVSESATTLYGVCNNKGDIPTTCNSPRVSLVANPDQQCGEGQWCYLSHSNAACSSVSDGATTLYGTCNDKEEVATTCNSRPVTIEPETECPGNYYCALKWNKLTCTPAGNGQTGQIGGVCTPKADPVGSCPY